jgi:NADH-quinone oxidoreductase subunit G
VPNLLPGARPVAEPGARAELAEIWDIEGGVLPSRPGRDTDGIIRAARAGTLAGLVVAGVDPADLAEPWVAEEALDRVRFLVSVELRRSAVARRADVVFPVAPAVEKAGAYVDWEGRVRPFDQVLNTTAMTDARVLDAIASELGVELACGDVIGIRRQLTAIAGTGIERPAPPRVAPVAGSPAAPAGVGRVRLATWHQLIDLGAMQDGDEYLAGTARPVVAALSRATAAGLAVGDGEAVTIRSARGEVTLPATIVDDMVDGVVWIPTNSAGSTVHRTLGVLAGAEVDIAATAGAATSAAPYGAASSAAGGAE